MAWHRFFYSMFLCVSFAPLLPLTGQTGVLEQRIKNIVSTVPGEIGVAALHIENGQRIEVNAHKRFPMASTAKIPMVLYCLSLIDSGELSLRQRELFTPLDIRMHRGCYRVLANHSYSIKHLIRLSVVLSDNAAPDKLLQVMGGCQPVTEWVRQHGIDGMSIDRPIYKLLADFAGVPLAVGERCTEAQFNKRLRQVTWKNRRDAKWRFYNDERDTTSPRAMVNLLARLYQGELVSASSTDFLLDCMRHCRWGENRIKRYLPKKTRLWHKTGRLDGMDSDVGIFELPHGKGHVALALYSNRSTTAEAKREEAFARIGREVYKFFA